MRRRRHGSRAPGRTRRLNWRKEHALKKCPKGEHDEYLSPSWFSREQKQWNGKDVHCEACRIELKTNQLSKFWQKRVKERYKILKELYKKVEALHPRKQFNHNGI